MNSSQINDKKLFEYFLTIFYVHYSSLLDNFKMTAHLKSRSALITSRLKSNLQVMESDEKYIDGRAREAAKLYTKSLIVRTKADPQLPKDILLVIKSSNKLLEIGANTQLLFDVKHRYDKDNNLRLTVEVCHNLKVIKKINIIETEISGKIGLKKTIECGSNRIILYFEWILDEDSCQRHLSEPSLIAKHFSSILLTLGNDYWTYFRIPFKVLATHTDSGVRRLIYCSLHEMAFILENSEKTNQLLPIFRIYLKEVSLIDSNYFQNCIVFFNDINPLERLQILSSLRPLFEDKSDLNQKLKTVMAKKLMALISDFSIKQIREQLIGLIIDFLATNESQSDTKLLIKMLSICVNKLFPKDMTVIDNTVEEMVDNQIQFVNNAFERLAIHNITEVKPLDQVCRQLVTEGILSHRNYNKIVEQIKDIK